MAHRGPGCNSQGKLSKAAVRRIDRKQAIRLPSNRLQDLDPVSASSSQALFHTRGRWDDPPPLRKAKLTVNVTRGTVNKLKEAERHRAEAKRAALPSRVQNALHREDFASSKSSSIQPDLDVSGSSEYPLNDWMEVDPEDDDPQDEVYQHYLTLRDAFESFQGPAVARQRRRDRRTRSERLSNIQRRWAAVYESLAHSYLEWATHEHEGDVPPISMCPQDNGVFATIASGMHWQRPTLYVQQRDIPGGGLENANCSLIRQGLLGSSPLSPTHSFSLRTLETYRLIRLHKPTTSVQAFVNDFSDSLHVPYRRAFRNLFDQAFDAYLAILREVDKQVAAALGRDEANWRVKHYCPCCTHRLPNEPAFIYDQIFSVDGGSSCKRLKDTASASFASNSSYQFVSSYHLTHEEVDVFKEEAVKQRTTRKRKQRQGEDEATAEASEEGDDENIGDVHLELGEPTEHVDGEGHELITKNVQAEPGLEGHGDQDKLDECVRRWKANADDDKKGMFACFDECGTFVAVCRHGFLLCFCDMVQSGELSKYPLAVINHVVTHVPGRKLLGFDIGCAFAKTLSRSSVGPKFQGRCTMNAFHGWAHIRPCQCRNHPLYVEGAGMSDMEDCERHFSLSNHVALLTRHATNFHRLQYLDMHFRHADQQKYKSLGYFLFNNTKQALSIINENKQLLADAHAKHQWTGATFKAWLQEEQEYLENVNNVPDEDKHLWNYMEAYDKWRAAENAEKALEEALIAETSACNGHEQDAPASLGKGRRKKRPTRAQLAQKALILFDNADNLLNLTELTTHFSETKPIDPVYAEARKRFNERKITQAVDHLESLVVHRLFELQKCHIQNTNYKMRTNIMKHLKVRSEAIKKAVRAYNTAARQAAVKRPEIKLDQVLEFNFLGQFDILRGSRYGIQDKPWSDPQARIIRDAWFRNERAKEELERVEVESARLMQWMLDEEKVYTSTINRLQSSNPPLAILIQARLRTIRLTHRNIRFDLSRRSNLPGYSPSFNLAPEPIQEICNDNPEGIEDHMNQEEYDSECECNDIDNLADGLARLDMLG